MTVTAAQIEAAKFLIGFLHEHKVPYQFTGGFAGNVYGSQWPLQDIDLEISKANFELVAYLLRQYVVAPTAFYQDDEFQLILLRLAIGGVSVDINQVENQQICVNGQWQDNSVDLKKATILLWQGLKIYVQPLDSLIAYKKLLGRSADVADLSNFL